MSLSKRIDAQRRNEPEDRPGYRPCRYCGKDTKQETLAQYGARCFECYERYCAEKNSHAVLAHGQHAHPTHEQADALRRAAAQIGRAPAGGSAAANVLHNLLTFEARTGRRLSGAQRESIRELQRKLGQSHEPVRDFEGEYGYEPPGLLREPAGLRREPVDLPQHGGGAA